MNLSRAKPQLCLVRWLLVPALAAGAQESFAASGERAATITNSLGMEFVRISPGTFTLGSGSGPKIVDGSEADYDEQPAHEVTISKPFYLLKGTVRDEVYQKSAPLTGGWNDAAAFCVWLSWRDGRTYRLPTEAEWVWAFQSARGAVDFEKREWVQDWHGIFSFDPVVDPGGPSTGLTKVIREGMQRYSLSPDATSFPWELPPTYFRVVLVTEPGAKPFLTPPPFSQAAIKQSTERALLGPDEKAPYFNVRFALPIPPENDTNLNGSLTGLDPSVMAHQHSPGFEILPNGDALAIYFSAKNSKGTSESDNTTRFVQARLRYGAEEWDPPELFYDFKGFNEQSALLWRDGNSVRFFGGGRGASALLPFKVAVTTNNGATWEMSLPHLAGPAKDFTPQPIVNGFRGKDGAICFAMDAAELGSFLWSSEDGVHWKDMGGRTGGRHSTIVPLGASGNLLSLGGKNTGIDGWMPINTSTDRGATWSESVKSPFPALGGNQRPCVIRLANGNLCFVGDSCHRNKATAPGGWRFGEGCIVAISKDLGKTWHIKRLPVELPHEADRKHGTLGYATVRQAPNGTIHVLSTMTHPCLHYEFNEAWVFSESGDIKPETTTGPVRKHSEKYASGKVRATWSSRACASGRYLLHGTATSYYEDGTKEHEVSYVDGRKTGLETFWRADAKKLWTWKHDPEENRSTWIHYWSNGRKRVESNWNTNPRARDLNRNFRGLVADGPTRHWKGDGSPAEVYHFTNGSLAGELTIR